MSDLITGDEPQIGGQPSPITGDEPGLSRLHAREPMFPSFRHPARTPLPVDFIRSVMREFFPDINESTRVLFVDAPSGTNYISIAWRTDDEQPYIRTDIAMSRYILLDNGRHQMINAGYWPEQNILYAIYLGQVSSRLEIESISGVSSLTERKQSF
jgi:hypothetical protein